jgi:Na+-transporting NADH:ubiquinone oxidoreductase subunit B
MNRIAAYSKILYDAYPERACRNYMLIILLSALPCFTFSLITWGRGMLIIWLVAWVPGMIIEFLFSRLRKKPCHGSSLVFSLLLVLMLPSTTPLWQVSMASAFGIFFGKEIFGGTGYHLISPVLLARLFLMIGYLPDIQGPHFASASDPENPDLWIIAGLLMLLPLLFQLAFVRAGLYILAGAFAGTALAIIWMSAMDLMPHESLAKTLVLDSFAFVLCFILLDPVPAPSSRWARGIYGFIIVVLAFVIGIFSDRYSEGIIVAMLFGNIISPLLDTLFRDSQKISA